VAQAAQPERQTVLLRVTWGNVVMTALVLLPVSASQVSASYPPASCRNLFTTSRGCG
jgi:hypothetical protein